MYSTYRFLTSGAKPVLAYILSKRLKNGKESPDRYLEKSAIIRLKRPQGHLIWFHAASVGEAQSTLILINKILNLNPKIHILVTTGTLTSAQMMEGKLPLNVFHQFYPLDHPKWVSTFLQHWKPDFILWMESELWPNMLHEIKSRKIPALLINAHMSPRSFKTWTFFSSLSKHMMGAFDAVLCQTALDKERFTALGAQNAIITDNIKYSAAPLKADLSELKRLTDTTLNRKIWLYASSHKGEEDIACDIHSKLKHLIPDLLTIIVPRHPNRRDEIKSISDAYTLNIQFRGEDKKQPTAETDVYIADTLGELGLFYRLAPIACIGRSLSDDGGGGHNPIEAAQLGCAVMHGPHVQNLQDIFDEMDSKDAAIHIASSDHLYETLLELFNAPEKIQNLQNTGLKFSREKNNVIERIMNEIEPRIQHLILDTPKLKEHTHAH